MVSMGTGPPITINFVYTTKTSLPLSLPLSLSLSLSPSQELELAYLVMGAVQL